MSNQIAVLRKVTVYNTSAQNNRVLESSAMTWGELQQELERTGIPYSGMRAVIGENQNELVTGQSHLMEGDMTLFLMPRRVKSGVSSLSHLVDPDGIRYHERDWRDEGVLPEDETFVTHFDLAMALQLKAQYYTNLAATHFVQAEGLVRNGQEGTLSTDEEEDENIYNDDGEDSYEEEDSIEEQKSEDWGFQTVRAVDPETQKLRDQADQLQRNMQE